VVVVAEVIIITVDVEEEGAGGDLVGIIPSM